jgi:hypothetical protein
MPDFLTRARDFLTGDQKDTAPVNRYEGFTANCAVVLRDRRGTSKAEIPDIDLKSESLGSDPLAIYKPTGAKTVDATKAMGNFTGWTFAAVNAIASEVANIQLRLYQITGDDPEEQDDHPLLDLIEGVNENMTGIELKYVTMALRIPTFSLQLDKARPTKNNTSKDQRSARPSDASLSLSPSLSPSPSLTPAPSIAIHIGIGMDRHRGADSDRGRDLEVPPATRGGVFVKF